MRPFDQRLEEARALSWHEFGKRIVFYLPGMFRCNGAAGCYPAVSVTGAHCALGCEHCKSALLKPMIAADSPETLLQKGLALASAGNVGMLVSGGCDARGCLPWPRFLPALKLLKERTGLHISVHGGFLDADTAHGLKNAGVDQVLLDVIGSDETYERILHIQNGLARLQRTLDVLAAVDMPVVPHVICGLHNGQMLGEAGALDMLAPLRPRLLVLLSFMGLPDTPMRAVPPPPAEAVADILCLARLRLPKTEISLGCARPRGDSLLETLAVDGGVNRLALPSEEARQRAAHYGLTIEYSKTCCSVTSGPSEASWLTSDEPARAVTVLR
ncbi:MAG: radical SAM protein [Desulfovibrio sp.]|jgi:uncharacterized radical SAM superfamily protein|nr:radical SAM protein [Desulfovibrio sp.]